MAGTKWEYNFANHLLADWTVCVDQMTAPHAPVIENEVLKIRTAQTKQLLSYYQATPDFAFTNGFIMAESIKATDTLTAYGIGVYIRINAKWHFVADFNADFADPPTGDDLVNPLYKTDNAARPCAQVEYGDQSGDDVSPYETWHWVGMRFNADFSIDAVYSTSTNHKIVPTASSWITSLTGLGTWGGSTIQEVGFRCERVVFVNRIKYFYVSKLALTTLDYDGLLTTGGIDQTVIDAISQIYFRTALNGGGNAKFVITNPFEEITTTTLKAQLKQKLNWRNTYGNLAFFGEVGTLQVRIDEAEYEVEEVSRKTMFTRVAANPTVFSTFLRYWEGRSVIDKDAFWQDKGALTTHIISFSKADEKIFSTRPIAASVTYVEDDFTTPYSPDNELGSGARLYYPFDESLGGDDSDQGLVVVDNHDPNPERWAAIFPCHIFEKFENSIESSELYLEISYVSKLDFSNEQAIGKPRVKVYDFSNTAWSEIDQVNKEEVEGTSVESEIGRAGAPGIFYHRGKPLPYTYNIEAEIIDRDSISDWSSGSTYADKDRVVYNNRAYSSLQGSNTNKVPTDEPTWWKLMIYDYLDTLTEASADDEFSKYEFKFLIQAGSHSFASTDEHNGFWLFEAKLTFEFLNDNEPEYSSAAINTVSQTTINSNATSGIDLPEEDGFGVDDIIIISKSAKDYVEDAWAASDINDLFTLDFQVTGADDFALTDDYTYKTFFQLLQDISSMLNATWWFDYPTETFVVRSVDLLTDSTVIIQASNVVGWDLGQWSIDYDATKERSSAIVVGDNVVIEQTFTPDHTFDLGDEVEIIDDSSIQTPTQARNLLTALKPIMESPGTVVRFTLDFSDPDNDYSLIKRGELITVQWPTTGSPTIANFSGASKLLIISMEHNVNEETGYNEHVTITAQKRES